MYPFIHLGLEMMRSRFRPKLPLDGVHVSHHRCLPWDIDMFGEMNNGRILTVFDLGRIPLAQRVGLVRVMIRRGWALTMAGAIVRYRRRILPFRKYEMRSACVGYDNRFFYLQQGLWRAGECHASIVYRAGARGPNGLIDPDLILKELDAETWSKPLPSWIRKWSMAEDARPWPPEI